MSSSRFSLRYLFGINVVSPDNGAPSVGESGDRDLAIGLGAMNAAVALRKDVVDGIRDDILCGSYKYQKRWKEQWDGSSGDANNAR